MYSDLDAEICAGASHTGSNADIWQECPVTFPDIEETDLISPDDDSRPNAGDVAVFGTSVMYACLAHYAPTVWNHATKLCKEEDWAEVGIFAAKCTGTIIAASIVGHYLYDVCNGVVFYYRKYYGKGPMKLSEYNTESSDSDTTESSDSDTDDDKDIGSKKHRSNRFKHSNLKQDLPETLNLKNLLKKQQFIVDSNGVIYRNGDFQGSTSTHTATHTTSQSTVTSTSTETSAAIKIPDEEKEMIKELGRKLRNTACGLPLTSKSNVVESEC